MRAYEHLKIVVQTLSRSYDQADEGRSNRTKDMADFNYYHGQAVALAGALGALKFVLENSDEAKL